MLKIQQEEIREQYRSCKEECMDKVEEQVESRKVRKSNHA